MPWTSAAGLVVARADAALPPDRPCGGQGPLDAVAAALRTDPPADVAAAAAMLRPLLPDALPADRAWATLRALGAADLSAGRLFEGHLNALALVGSHGGGAQRARAAAIRAAGGLLAIWAADAGGDPVVLDGDVLRGTKVMCSGAGAVAAVVIVARTDQGPQLVWLGAPEAERFDPPAACRLPVGMQATNSVAFHTDGLVLSPSMRLGAPGAYLAEPAYSGGMWRILALQLGALDALAALFTEALRGAGRDALPAQRARVLDNAIDLETVALWTHRAMRLVEAPDRSPGTTAQVALAREVTLRAAEAVMARVERGLGLASQVAGARAERLHRDLATFLRQPAPDLALESAMPYLLDRAAPDRWT